MWLKTSIFRMVERRDTSRQSGVYIQKHRQPWKEVKGEKEATSLRGPAERGQPSAGGTAVER
jgi:hypothetical protein